MLRQHNWRRYKEMNELPVKDAFVDQVATTVCRWGLQMPVRIFLEAGHPVTFLGGQLLWLAQPALSLVISSQIVRQAAYLLEEPETIQALIAKLEMEEVG